MSINDLSEKANILDVNTVLANKENKEHTEFIGYATGTSDSISLIGKSFNTLVILAIRADIANPIYEYSISIPHNAFINQSEYRFLKFGDWETGIVVGFTKDIVILNGAVLSNGTNISSTTSIYVYGV